MLPAGHGSTTHIRTASVSEPDPGLTARSLSDSTRRWRAKSPAR